jgi:hypothetical protein
LASWRSLDPASIAPDAIGAVLAQTLVWFYAKWRSNFAAPHEFSAAAAEQ